ncbi:hypothetical protein SAMN05216302_10633 [Nitrosomonas aestuarii]|uniref:Uncharacterized protein n=1 Tax=Nitrosomonas aestuarii TaxID=52441 RepID=A0A1I4GTR7_9PROT|nr:hypothetical protein [Nitrosomonas aestuarii]SFL33482.1 hypothetical protein SAMN05216302_10633 [Nitrosomonas aestuarii]
MKQAVFDEFHEVIIGAVEQSKTKKSVKMDDDDNDEVMLPYWITAQLILEAILQIWLQSNRWQIENRALFARLPEKSTRA